MTTQLEGLYERDFYAWAEEQARELRRWAELRPNTHIDFANLIEEIEGLARAERNTCFSQTERLLVHLMKLEHSPTPAPRRQWLNSVDRARRELLRHLSAAIRRIVDDEYEKLCMAAARTARLELLDHHERQAADALPTASPYTLEEILTDGWYPANRHGLVDEL